MGAASVVAISHRSGASAEAVLLLVPTPNWKDSTVSDTAVDPDHRGQGARHAPDAENTVA